MMERFAQIQRTGGPEVIEWADVPLTEPAPGEVRMRNLAVGLNFIDTYHRSGLYPMAKPCGLGMEAAGIIEAVGDGVSDWQVGDRVATFGPTIGAYCTARNIAAKSLFGVPDDISHEVAAAGLLKGCTTEFLVERCAKVQPQWDVLVHAAAGEDEMKRALEGVVSGWFTKIEEIDETDDETDSPGKGKDGQEDRLGLEDRQR